MQSRYGVRRAIIEDSNAIDKLLSTSDPERLIELRFGKFAVANIMFVAPPYIIY